MLRGGSTYKSSPPAFRFRGPMEAQPRTAQLKHLGWDLTFSDTTNIGIRMTKSLLNASQLLQAPHIRMSRSSINEEPSISPPIWHSHSHAAPHCVGAYCLPFWVVLFDFQSTRITNRYQRGPVPIPIASATLYITSITVYTVKTLLLAPAQQWSH